MTDTERTNQLSLYTNRIMKCMRRLDLSVMPRDELLNKIRDLRIDEIEDLIWEMYCFISDVRDTLNM